MNHTNPGPTSPPSTSTNGLSFFRTNALGCFPPFVNRLRTRILRYQGGFSHQKELRSYFMNKHFTRFGAAAILLATAHLALAQRTITITGGPGSSDGSAQPE